MADIPVAQVVPMQDNDNLPIAREYVPHPFPVSMFDLVPGRRYQISNREITPQQVNNPQVVPLNNYQEGQHTFIATFITLTTSSKNMSLTSFHPIQFFDDINHSSGIIENNRELGWRRGLQEQLGYTNVYPIFSYEQGLTQHQLEDLTLDLDMLCAKSTLWDGRNILPAAQIAILKQQLLGVINQELTWNRPMTEPLPGLLYYGHDTHSGFGGGFYTPPCGGGSISRSFINRNFGYNLFKHFVERNRWLPNSPGRGNPECWVNSVVTDLYFNDQLQIWEGQQPVAPFNRQMPYITRLQNHILKNTRPMIVLPGYWSIIDDNDLNQNTAVTNVVRPAIERGRRRLEGGKRIKTKKKRKKQKTKRKKRRKMRARAK